MTMKNSIVHASQPFDALAINYDKEFTDTDIGKLLRERTHELMSQLFTTGNSVLELNCGTGEDAAFLARRGIYVTATDGSPEMIKISRAKISALGLEKMVKFEVCKFDKLKTILGDGQQFDGIVSNFGGLNCAQELDTLVASIAKHVKIGGHFFLCAMGRWSPWEWLYLGYRGKFRRIWERIRGKTIWRGQSVQYYTPGEFLHCFKPYCEIVKISGLGFFLPPTYAGSIVSRNPTVFQWLNSIEKRLQSAIGIPQLSDHFMLVLTRK